MPKSKSHHSSVKIRSSPDLDRKITERYGLPQTLTTTNYEIILIEIEKTAANILGIQITESCIVHSVNREDVDVIFGDLWLELNGIWLENKKQFTEIYRKIKKESNGALKLKLKIARLLWKLALPEDRMPMDILPRREYKYHLAVIYGIPGMHLTLGLKAINGKIFVSGVTEETLGIMAFAVGDSILEVDRCMVGNITGAYDLIKQNLKTNGMVSCVVERADSANASFYVREAIRSEKNPFKEERLNKDVEKICRKEKRRLLREPDAQPLKSILRQTKMGDTPTTPNRIKMRSKHDIVHISADINPKLLQAVPSHNVVPSDTLLAPGKSAESILSEISSEVSKEQDSDRQSKEQRRARPMRQKDCRLTTGTKVIKRRQPSIEQSKKISIERKCPIPSSSPTKNDTDSGKRSPATLKTQNTDSAKKTTKTQNTDSGRKCPTISKTPQDTDSRKKTSTTISKTPNDTDSRKKTTTSVNNTKNSNSGKSLKNCVGFIDNDTPEMDFH